jgi:hypothetical protein
MSAPKARTTRIIEASVVLTILGGMAVLLRLASVARGDLNLAFALAHDSDFAEILLSTLLISVPAASVTAALIFETFALKRWHDALSNREESGLVWPLIWTAIFAASTAVAEIFQNVGGQWIFPVVLIVWACSLWLALTFFGRFFAWLRAPRFDLSARGSRSGLVILGEMLILSGVVLLLPLLAFRLMAQVIPTDQPWVPSEALYLSNERPFTGYVIGSDETWSYVLIGEPREIRIIPSENIKRRYICANVNSFSNLNQTLWLATTHGKVDLSGTTCSHALKVLKKDYAANTKP